MSRDEFFGSQKVMRLATVSKDGMPHVVPVWYGYRNKMFYVGTHTSTAKAQNISRTGRATFCIDDGVGSPIYGVMAKCAASLMTGGESDKIARWIISRYMDVKSIGATELLDETDCIIRLSPEKITVWKY